MPCILLSILSDINALPKTAMTIPPHCINEMFSPNSRKAKSAANIGADWVIGIVRDTSRLYNTLTTIVPEQPNNNPELIAAKLLTRVASLGIPTIDNEIIPTVIDATPTSNNNVSGVLAYRCKKNLSIILTGPIIAAPNIETNNQFIRDYTSKAPAYDPQHDKDSNCNANKQYIMIQA